MKDSFNPKNAHLHHKPSRHFLNMIISVLYRTILFQNIHFTNELKTNETLAIS